MSAPEGFALKHVIVTPKMLRDFVARHEDTLPDGMTPIDAWLNSRSPRWRLVAFSRTATEIDVVFRVPLNEHEEAGDNGDSREDGQPEPGSVQ